MPTDPLPPGDDDYADTEPLHVAEHRSGDRRVPPALARFERVYRTEFGPVVAFFARRYEDPQLVADLTADTFVAAIREFGARDPQAGSVRAWAIGLARRVDAAYRESDPRGEDSGRGRSLELLLDRAETRELMWWVDVERSSRGLIERLAGMSRLDREAFELVELCGLTPAEAASELGLGGTATRVRLLRARSRLKREGGEDA